MEMHVNSIGADYAAFAAFSPLAQQGMPQNLAQSLKQLGLEAAESGGITAPLNARTSLTSDVSALKAQSEALDTLDGIMRSIDTAFQKLQPSVDKQTNILMNLAAAEPDSAAAESMQQKYAEISTAIDQQVSSFEYNGQPLFEPTALNHNTARDSLQASPTLERLNLLSGEQQKAIAETIQRAFDLYA
jgi:hypothetical protein